MDTVGLPYDTLRFTCPVPDSLRVMVRDNYFARIGWVDSDDNTEWMVSVGPAGGDPDNGRMIMSSSKVLTINGLSPDTSYNVYVKGQCKRTMYEGWGGWSVPVTLEAMPPQGGIAIPDGERFLLSPNPASGTVTVTTEAQQGTLTVVDMQGRQVLSMPLTGKETVIDIHTLAAGTYIVSLNTPQGPSSLKLTVE
ncbi:MAG: T9SS type A sorting domain-containing protein [Bacteroidales bacterium]|nr:T9SS type A sorting domain-containing protein [Bacteroidales bacterium]